MKVFIAIDSFKGSSTSQELNDAARLGVLQANPTATVVTQAIADGGEGTLSMLAAQFEGTIQSVATVDLLHRPLTAKYLLAAIDEVPTAVIESASVVGIDRITPNSETFANADTAGLAPMMLDAVAQGARRIVLTLGGTGTSDGGRGLLAGLGVDPLAPGWAAGSHWPDIEVIGLADVTNPYAGPQGYAAIFGPQKGGTPGQIVAEDAKAVAFAAAVKPQVDLQQTPGAGAAGGLGGALVILGGSVAPGFETLARYIHLDDQLQGVDLIITGEGRLDAQTSQGKVPFGMATHGAKFQIPTVAVCGSLGADLGQMESLLLASLAIQPGVVTLAEAMAKLPAQANLTRTVRQIMKLIGVCHDKIDCN